MKLINTPGELSRQLCRLCERYDHIEIATAWASADTDAFRVLAEHEERIGHAVIGTHFYQTDPDVLDRFVDSTKVKFILQADGVFHPKVYVFWDAQRWEVIIGSPNLTRGALTKNSELSVLITSSDGQSGVRDEVSQVIREYWDRAASITRPEADNYRRIWKIKARDLRRVSGVYGELEASKPAVRSKVMSLDWERYVQEVRKDSTHGFNERLEMLEAVGQQFQQHEHFNDMPLDARKGIAGLGGNTIPHSKWFGSMVGAGVFFRLVNGGHPALSQALDQIPLTGEVRKEHYDRYVEEYLLAYPAGRDGLATATRLLAMKRPDTFLCVDARNRTKLIEDVGIRRGQAIDYARYWDEVAVRLIDAPWWQSPEPADPHERAVWRARAAMLDAIFYEE